VSSGAGSELELGARSYASELAACGLAVFRSLRLRAQSLDAPCLLLAFVLFVACSGSGSVASCSWGVSNATETGSLSNRSPSGPRCWCHVRRKQNGRQCKCQWRQQEWQWRWVLRLLLPLCAQWRIAHLVSCVVHHTHTHIGAHSDQNVT